MFGGHPNFAVREPEHVILTDNQGKHVNKKISNSILEIINFNNILEPI